MDSYNKIYDACLEYHLVRGKWDGMLATYIKNHTADFMSTTKKLHKEWRKHFNDEVLKRDKNQCKICKCKSGLDVHHITDRSEMPNGGYSSKNGITLCQKHHLDAEQYHRSKHLFSVEGFHPNDLYKLIGSSYEEAVEECKNL